MIDINEADLVLVPETERRVQFEIEPVWGCKDRSQWRLEQSGEGSEQYTWLGCQWGPLELST